ncbi:MAG: sensor histidine kinase, partial [Candidatus Nitrosopolaris sp.]
MTPLQNTRKIVIICIILIISISYGLFFYLQNNTESNIKNSLFEQQKQLQIESARALAQHIGSDLDSIMARLQGLANSGYLQQGELLSANKTGKLLQESFLEMNTVTPIHRLFILDKDNIVTQSVPKALLGLNLSNREWVKQTKSTLNPVFSNGFEGKDGKFTVALTYPIVNRETGKYLGLVAGLIPTIQFFQHYGNIYNINSQYLAVLDRQSVQLTHPVKALVGTPFFGNYTQQIIGHSTVLNNLIRQVMAGQPGFAVYGFINGERLNTGYPVFVLGRPTYFVFVITPTASIYSHINNVIITEKIETFSLLAGVTAAIAALILFLIRWNSTLDNQIKKRTRELDVSNRTLQLTTEELKRTNESLAESNRLLTTKNEQLAIHDKMQKEFINVAAHELRTPTQAIIGFSELLEMESERSEPFVDPILRNAKRLHRLANDILDVTRIESQSLNLSKEQFDLNDLLLSIIKDRQQQIEKDGKDKDLKLVYNESKLESTLLRADKERLTQVISNLLDNAIKFTNRGMISIIIDKSSNGQEVTISVKDTGSEIHPDILPRLFSKFVSKSFQGTGLGLFISKSIIEAH